MLEPVSDVGDGMVGRLMWLALVFCGSARQCHRQITEMEQDGLCQGHHGCTC